MKTKLSLVLTVLVAFAAGIGGTLWWTSSQSGPGGTTIFGPSQSTRDALAVLEARNKELEARLAKLLADLDRRDEQLKKLLATKTDLDKRNQEMKAEVEKMNQEWTFSYGTTKDAGKFIGSLMKDALAMRNMDRNDPENAAKMRDMFLKFTSLGPILQEMQKLDDKPKEFAEFRAEALGEALDLDESQRQRVAGIVEKYKTQAQSLPEGSDERAQLNEKAIAEIRTGLNEEQQGLMDAIPSTRMGAAGDLLETPSLDPSKWRDRMRPPRGP